MPRFERYAQGTPSYVELTTPDQAAAKEFYAALFGWELEDVPMGDAGYYVAASTGGGSVAGIAGPPPGTEDHEAYWGVYLAVDDVDAAAARVAPAGGTIEAGPVDVLDLGRMVVVRDPTGAYVNLWQAGATIGSTVANEPGTPIWNELVTPDVPAATAFYAAVLGVSWEEQPMDGGPAYTCLMVEGRPVAGALPPPAAEVPAHWNVYFDVEDVDATAEVVTALGGRVVAPPFDVPGVGRMVVLSDPQGATFNLLSSTAAA